MAMTTPLTIPQQVCWPRLPLAVYREIAAHLAQVSGVEAMMLPQTATQFDYELSQVGGLQLSWPESLDSASQARVLAILEYYSQRYGAWRSP
ncbi:MAG: hypothetical protein MH252_06580 [Thermosynechococcaceae cyanobacterium MS004]|nr:hypothetical protein [Thermosynechococcaceae cyanobacterium MS004]